MSSPVKETVASIMARVYADIHTFTWRRKNIQRVGMTNSTISRAENLLKRVAENSKLYTSDLRATGGSGSEAKPPGLSSPRSIKSSSEFTRYNQFIAQCGWMLMAICAHSQGFIYASRHQDEDVWINTVCSILENSRSIELFAKVRGLDWLSVLPAEENEDDTSPRKDTREKIYVPVDDPFHWYVSKDGNAEQPFYKGKFQESIAENMYLSEDSLRASNFVMDTYALEQCFICGIIGRCDCNLVSQNRYFQPPILELTPCGSRGLGIRALQPIPKETLLGEYVGVSVSAIDEDFPDLDFTYGLALISPEAVTDEPLAIINAEQYGNWARFLNHSCQASTVFFSAVMGGRLAMVVKTVRDIEMFEELTVDYGEKYFTDSIDCACGEEDCCYGKNSRVKVEGDSTDFDGDGDGDAAEEANDSREYTEGDETGDNTEEIDSGPACEIIETDLATGLGGLHMSE